ncbi:isochorismatase family protein [Iningainema tapete]|uniref:Cysteine hydrolase n=1 Tax=Iningainema tapete BLCC-T55 TaxID=2748662 RepID=A0A8J6XZT5_9CYAN|nr:cysteine hydrolase [Iningainema tapete BLCC-T55]
MQLQIHLDQESTHFTLAWSSSAITLIIAWGIIVSVISKEVFMNLCLFIIDIQNGFIAQNTSHIPQTVKSLLEQNIFEYVVFTRFINTLDSPYVKYLNWHGLFSETEQKIVDEIEPFAQVIFDKTVYTGCNEETLSFIRKRNIQTVFICGIDTEGCVLKTAIDFFENNILTYVLEYYSASNGGKNYHQAAILVLSQLIGRNNIITEPLDKNNFNKYLIKN